MNENTEPENVRIVSVDLAGFTVIVTYTDEIDMYRLPLTKFRDMYEKSE